MESFVLLDSDFPNMFVYVYFYVFTPCFLIVCLYFVLQLHFVFCNLKCDIYVYRNSWNKFCHLSKIYYIRNFISFDLKNICRIALEVFRFCLT